MAFWQEQSMFGISRYDQEFTLEWLDDIVDGKTIGTIAISNVGKQIEDIREELGQRCSRLIILDNNTPLPITNLYHTSETLGSDRVASVVAAHTLFPDHNCIVFDFGTAITIDIINKNGDYKGGNISLGTNTRFKAIHQYTKRLPLIEKGNATLDMGTSTQEAILNGVILGIMFEVEGYIRKYPNHLVVFTGGDAFYFAKKLKTPIFAVCNLVLMGLARIAEIDANK